MSPSAVLKKVKEQYPELAELPKAKLRLVESALLYASTLSSHDLLTEKEHDELMERILPGGPTPGRSLQAYRYREELTQQQLAKKSGISQANISAMEKGKRPIGLKVAKKLADILNCRYQKFIED